MDIKNTSKHSDYNFGNKFTKSRYKYIYDLNEIVGVFVETRLINKLINENQLDYNQCYQVLWYTNLLALNSKPIDFENIVSNFKKEEDQHDGHGREIDMD